MSIQPRYLAAAALLATLAACSGTDDAASNDSATATVAGTPDLEHQLADVNAYRLTMERMDRYLAAQRNIAAKEQAMSDAEKAAIKASAPSGDTKDVDGLARQIEAVAPVRDAIRAAGLSPREYATITYAYMSAAMAAGIQKMRPADDADSLARAMKASPENARFIRENEAELQRRMAGMQ